MSMRAETARGQTPASPAPAVETSPPMLPSEPRPGKAQDQPERVSRDVCPLGKVEAAVKVCFVRSHFIAAGVGAIKRNEAVGGDKDEHGQPCARRGPRLDQVHPPGRPCRRLSCVSIHIRAFVGSCGMHARLTLILGRRTRPAKNAMVS